MEKHQKPKTIEQFSPAPRKIPQQARPSVFDDMVMASYYQLEKGKRTKVSTGKIYVPRQKYVDLFDARLLSWQVERRPRPIDEPDPEVIRTALAAAKRARAGEPA